MLVSGVGAGGLWRDSRTFRGLNAQFDADVADGWSWRAEAKGEVDAGDGHSPALSTSRRRARQSIREYILGVYAVFGLASLWLQLDVLPQVDLSNLRDFSVQAIVCFPLLAC